MRVIELNNVGKRFPLINSQPNLHLWAVKDITMDIRQGEIIGIIGRNGAGKTTLLKIMSGIIPPTEGEVKIEAKVAGLFMLGAGFQNGLSGRENIYLNGGILRMTNSEIDEKYKDIVDFSELSDFIDMPLGGYSDGMRVRLGFSIAIHADFEVLLIDEALMVGDISFQKKCFETLLKYRREGKTMIITTQALGVIEQLCDTVFVLEEGEIIFSGQPREATDRYRKLLNEKEFSQRRKTNLVTKTKRWAEDMKDWGQRQTNGKAAIDSVEILNRWGKKANSFRPGEKMRLKIHFEAYSRLKDTHFGVALFREDGVYCYGPNSRWDGYRIDLHPGKGSVIFEYRNLFLAPGTYYLSVVIWEKNETFAYDYHRGYYKMEIKGKNGDGQLLSLPYRWNPFSRQPLLQRYYSVLPRELQRNEKSKVEKSGAIKIEFVDREGNSKNEFMTGEELNIKVVFEPGREKVYNKDRRLWIGLFRSDGIYCQGITRNVNNRDKEIILTYAPLRLLPGEYRISAAFWNGGERRFTACGRNTGSFKIVFTKEDHGTVYLSHRWILRLPENSKKGNEEPEVYEDSFIDRR